MMMFVSHLYYQTVSEYLLTVHDNRWQSILLGVYDTYSHKQVRVYVTILFSALTRMFPKPTFAP